MGGTDELIGVFDRALRALTGGGAAERSAPEAEEGTMTEAERKHAAGLMRVNHAGEICAQALYEGQALTARGAQVRETLRTAAAEENDHLAWCRERLDELDGRPSMLDPVFYAASFALGAAVGVLGDKVSLGFVEATEEQVKRHLDQHIDDLPETDERSRAILTEMRADESRHGENAKREGGVAFPEPVKEAMTLASKVMTETTYRL